MRALRPVIHAIVGFYLLHEFAALFFLLLFEEAGIPLPVPGDTLLVWAGLHHARTLGYTLAVLGVSSAGVFVGSSVLYVVIRRRGRPLLEKYGKYVRLSGKRLDRMEGWFRRHGVVAILCGRMIPGLRIPTTVMAGLSDVPYVTYAPCCAVTAIAWAALYFYLGELLQRPLRFIAPRVAGTLDTLSAWLIFGGVLALLAAVIFVWRGLRVNQRNTAGSETEPPTEPPPGGAGSGATREPSGVA